MATTTPKRRGRPPKERSERVYTEMIRVLVTPAMARYIREHPEGASAYLRDLVFRDVDAALDVAMEIGADAETVARLRGLLDGR
jgi:hypothetical protein